MTVNSNKLYIDNYKNLNLLKLASERKERSEAHHKYNTMVDPNSKVNVIDSTNIDITDLYSFICVIKDIKNSETLRQRLWNNIVIPILNNLNLKTSDSIIVGSNAIDIQHLQGIPLEPYLLKIIFNWEDQCFSYKTTEYSLTGEDERQTLRWYSFYFMKFRWDLCGLNHLHNFMVRDLCRLIMNEKDYAKKRANEYLLNLYLSHDNSSPSSSPSSSSNPINFNSGTGYL